MVTKEATPAKTKPTRIHMSYEEFREWAFAWLLAPAVVAVAG